MQGRVQFQVKQRLESWVEAIAQVLMEAGLDPALATPSAEDAVITIQGALILARGVEDATIFQRAIAELPQRLCNGLS